MHKPKPYRCSVCGAEVPDLPMPVLKHQMSHVERRPFARDRHEPDRAASNRNNDTEGPPPLSPPPDD
jgi:hypothetical protein